MISLRLASGFIGALIVLSAIFDAFEKKRTSVIYKTITFKKSPIKFILMISVDILIGTLISYISYLGKFVLGTTISLVIAHNCFSLAFGWGINKLLDDEDEERGSGFITILFCLAIAALIIFYSVTTGISTSDIMNFIVDFLDA